MGRPESDRRQTVWLGERGLAVGCARCGGIAARFEVALAGVRSDDLLSDHDRLVRTGFLGGASYARDPRTLLRLYEAIASGDLRDAYDLESDALGCYCPDCDAAYCERCWDVGPPEFTTSGRIGTTARALPARPATGRSWTIRGGISLLRPHPRLRHPSPAPVVGATGRSPLRAARKRPSRRHRRSASRPYPTGIG
jgi:hypothetical protein